MSSHEQCHFSANTIEKNEDSYLPSSTFLELYKHAAINSEKNVVLSPLSISLALSAIYPGAGGQTATEIKTAFFDDEVDVVTGAANLMQHFLDGKQYFRLEIANALFLNEGFKLKNDYESLVTECLSSNVQCLPFTSRPALSIKSINRWVSDKTHDLVPSVLSNDFNIEICSAILINALYFKGDWRTPFNKRFTKEEEFHGVNDDELVKMMHDWNTKANYFEDIEAGIQVLGLDYQGGGLSMIFMLPNKTKNFKEFEQSLTANIILRIISNMNRQIMKTIKIPKFKVECKVLLKEVLSKMGVESMFDFSRADFSGMSWTEGLYVSEAFQTAVISVDEFGTEAASFTSPSSLTTSARFTGERPSFIADSPFLYLLYDKQTEAVPFIGRYLGHAQE